MASFKLGSSSLQRKYPVGVPFRGGCTLLKRKETPLELICTKCKETQHSTPRTQHSTQHSTPTQHPTTGTAHPTTPHHSTGRHTQHNTARAQRTHTHPTHTPHRHSTGNARNTGCAQYRQRNATHSTHSTANAHTQPTQRSTANAAHTQHSQHTAHSQRSTAQRTLVLSVCVAVPVCLCVRVLSYSDSKCVCAVFCVVFSVCAVFGEF